MKGKKIAVVRLDRIGDLILTTPAIASLKATFPDSRITAIVNSYNKAVLEHSSHVDEIWTWEWDLTHFLALRKKAFDCVLVFSPTAKSYWIAFLSGARIRAGYVYKSRILPFLFSRLWLNRVAVCRVDQKDFKEIEGDLPHEIEQNLEVVQAAADGKAVIQDKLAVFVPEEELNWARKILPPKPRIAVHLAESWFSGLPERFFESLVTEILKHAAVFITYGPQEKKIVEKLKLPREVQCFGNLSFSRWAALFKSAQAVLSPDTGALHLAASQGVPVVALLEARFYPYHARRWRPWQVPHRLFRKDDPALFKKLIESILPYVHAENTYRSNLQS